MNQHQTFAALKNLLEFSYNMVGIDEGTGDMFGSGILIQHSASVYSIEKTFQKFYYNYGVGSGDKSGDGEMRSSVFGFGLLEI